MKAPSLVQRRALSRFWQSLLLVWLALLCPAAWPADPPASAPTAAQVKLELLQQLQADGMLSPAQVQQAQTRYVNAQDLQRPLASGEARGPADPGLWERYVSWTAFFKVLAVVCLLVAFSGVIIRIGASIAFLIVQVPRAVYQTLLLAGGLIGIVRPDLLWASQAFYIALFSAFANLVVLGWIASSYPRLRQQLTSLVPPGLHPSSMLSFGMLLYFAALALAYQSQTFGFFAAVSLSGMLSFGLYYRPGVLTLYFAERATNAVILGHLAVLLAHAAMKASGHGTEQIRLFAVGIEYYCTIAMGVGFLIAASPFGRRRSPLPYLALFAATLLAAVTGYFFLDLRPIGSIVCCIAVLLALEWIGYFSWRAGFLWGSALAGVTLFGAAQVLERYAPLLILKLA